MRTGIINIGGFELPVCFIKTVVIGSGCAGFNAADWLHDLGERDLALVTEGVGMGASRNTGSDKQTYYKLSLSSEQADSIGEMARTLAGGMGVNGDTALVEAACSVKSFFKLVNLGVPFPANVYGEYVGYKTDHDPRSRASSAGPLTSRYMTECLERSVNRKGIPIIDNMQVVKLIAEEGRIVGLLAIDLKNTGAPHMGFTLFECNNVIMATGGPASTYHSSVYPESQTGMTGMALEAGVRAANLQEWQYGLASVKFRWNVSGSYQQVLPRYIAVDADGNEREFLNEYFGDPFEAVSTAFLKGYQWPFDAAKIKGSSLIDIIVHRETSAKGNSVFMDFRRNPSCMDEGGFGRLSAEAREYLSKSGALLGRPADRLAQMNRPAIALYADHGIDLYSEPLEVAVCAQHCNGGIDVDIDWQSNISGLYASGEAAGTFGAYRPGGAALNSGQVGAMRAAEHIAYRGRGGFEHREDFTEIAGSHVSGMLNECAKLCAEAPGTSDIANARLKAQKLMSLHAAHIRGEQGITVTTDLLRDMLDGVFSMKINGSSELPQLLKYRDMLITQLAVLSSVRCAAAHIGSRGSALVRQSGEAADVQTGRGYPDPEAFTSAAEGGEKAAGPLPYAFIPLKADGADKRVITAFSEGEGFKSEICGTRPLPEGGGWFENVWKDYNERTGRSAP